MKFEDRVKQVDWSNFETTYGNAKNVGNLLVKLSSETKTEAMDASHELWCGLCHQHAYVSSAALPALPFLLEMLVSADNQLKVEILDIFAGFAVCLARDRRENKTEEWKISLSNELNSKKVLFTELLASNDEVISSFADTILSHLET